MNVVNFLSLKTSNFLQLLISLLLIIGLALGYYFYSKSKEFYRSMTQCKREYEEANHQRAKLFNYEKMATFIRSNSELFSELELEPEGSKFPISLQEIASDTIVMFFYSKLNCNSCLDSVLGSIELGNENHVDFFYLISDYDIKRDLYNFKRKSRISQEVFKNKNKIFSNIYETFPFFAVYTKSDLFIFFPDKDFPERTLEFLNNWQLLDA